MSCQSVSYCWYLIDWRFSNIGTKDVTICHDFFTISFSDQNTTAFKEVAIIRHPRVGEYAFGFITSTVTLQVPCTVAINLFANLVMVSFLYFDNKLTSTISIIIYNALTAIKCNVMMWSILTLFTFTRAPLNNP